MFSCKGQDTSTLICKLQSEVGLGLLAFCKEQQNEMLAKATGMSGLQVAYCDVGEIVWGRGSGEKTRRWTAGKNSYPIAGLRAPAG